MEPGDMVTAEVASHLDPSLEDVNETHPYHRRVDVVDGRAGKGAGRAV